jgi:O-antigen ligase
MSEKLSKIGSVFFLSVYIFFLVFGFKIINIALIALILFVLLDWKRTKKNIYTYLRSYKIAYAVIGIFLGYQFLHGLFFQELGEKRFGLLGLVALSSIVLSWFSDIRILLKIYLSVLTVLAVRGMANVTNYYFDSINFNMVEGGHINGLLLVSRPYLGFLLALGILFCAYLIRFSYGKIKWFYCGLSFFYIVYLIIIGNRIQLVSLVFVLLIYILIYLKTNWKYKTLGLLAVCLSILSVFYFSTTLKKRFELSSFNQSEIIEKLKEQEPRIIIWSCAKELAKERDFNKLIGLGKEKLLQAKMADCYDVKTKNNRLREYFMKSLFGTHNQFIEYYLLTGFFGFLAFAGVFFYFWKILKKEFIPMAMLILLFNFCMVENLMNVQLGSYLFGFVIWLCLSINQTFKHKNDFSF